MAITNSKLIPYQERINTILGTLMDKNLTQAQALGRLPKAKASIEKLIDTLLKSKEKVSDAIIIAEIDEIVALAEKGLAEFGAKIMGNNLDSELPSDPFADSEPQTGTTAIIEEIGGSTPSTKALKSVIEGVLKNKTQAETTIDAPDVLIAQNNIVYQAPEEQAIEEGYFIYQPNGRVKAFDNDEALAEYLGQANRPESLFIVKGKKLKAKVQKSISFE